MAIKILFCFYPLYVKYNHGVALLSALCKKEGIKTELYLLDEPGKFEMHLVENRYDYIGFSCVTEHDYKKSLPFMEIAEPHAVTLLGGVYARRGLALDAPVNYICRGEGERLPYFLMYEDCRLFNEKMLCEDINSLPLPDYELFRNIPFERGFPMLEGKKVLPYYSSRGCPYKCSFCEVQGQTGMVRTRYKVAEDLRQLTERYKPDYFFVGDEMLPYYNPAWRESWEDFKHPFIAYIRADIPKDILVWLWSKGLKGVAFGVESGDEEYRNYALNKNLLDKDVYRTVNLLKGMEIEYATFFMTNTPGETFAVRAKTYKMASELGGYPFIWEYENLFEGRREIWAGQQQQHM